MGSSLFNIGGGIKMTIVMQIYLTILLGLILLTIISLVIAKIADGNGYETLCDIFGIINIISFILTISWIAYLLLALIWHLY